MKGKFLRPEGNQYSRIIQLMAEVGYSKPVNVELATVVAAAPDLMIKLDADELELGTEALIVSKHLTRHERIVSLDYAFPDTVDVGDGSEETVSSRQNIGSTPSIPYEQFEMKYVRMTYEDVLKVGARVLVACLEEDMVYIILDEAVWY